MDHELDSALATTDNYRWRESQMGANGFRAFYVALDTCGVINYPC